MTLAEQQPDRDIQPGADHGQSQPRPASAGHTLFVISRRCGRLANRLVLFANFIALAEEQGHRLVNFTFHSYAGLFEATRRDIYCRYPAGRRQSWLDVIPGVAAGIRRTRMFYHAARAARVLHERFPVFGRRVVTLRETPGADVTWLDGPEVLARIRGARVVFVHDWKFRVPDRVLQRHAEKIRAYFRPIEQVNQASHQAVDRLRRGAEVVIGVHIRQGDYRIWRGGKYFFPSARYAAWMRELAGQFPARKVSFLVCSDEPRDAREFPGLAVGFGTGSAVGDLYALAKCDCVFGPPSTFTAWASFYSNTPLLHLFDGGAPIERARFRVSPLS
jgi:hypothetical protein